MKANFRKLKNPIENAFHIRKDFRSRFDDQWHFHEMIELVLIIKGNGKRYIGDSIENFSNGDVILVGGKLPHVWRSADSNSKSLSNKKCASIIIQFNLDFLGPKFLELSESKEIKELFSRAELGISFQKESRKLLANKINNLMKYDGMERLIKLLEVLRIASIAKEYKLLASPFFKDIVFKSDLKINKVFEYVMDNFSNPITLDEIATIASMNKTAFCRYFKRRTEKTFSAFLNEIRIGYACKMISEENHTITEAAYSSGYNSPSNFNKQFRLIKGISPSEFYSNSKEL